VQARDVEPPVASEALTVDGDAEASVAETVPQLSEMLGPGEETARGILEAEQALHLLRERFEQTEHPEERGDLAAEALDHVERQLQLTREQRRRLDRAEAQLWARQNRLEGFLIKTRGSAWWHTRRTRRGRNQSQPTNEPRSPSFDISYEEGTAS
jgi:hypothetical protein